MTKQKNILQLFINNNLKRVKEKQQLVDEKDLKHFEIQQKQEKRV